MFIYNKKTKVIQECANKDAINACKGDEERYIVANTEEAIRELIEKPQESRQEAEEEPSEDEGKEQSQEEEKGAPEGNPEEEEEPSGDDPLNEAGDADLEKLNAMNVKELRELAKSKGIKGYANMTKDTLVALIMDL